MKTVLVTGGAGFIGSHFVDYILEKHPDYRVVCIDKLTYAASLDNLKKAFKSSRFRFIKADICDKVQVDKAFCEQRPEIVVNFAAESHVDRSILDPGIFLKTNISGVGVLMDACIKYNVSRFHQVSTDEVYGSLSLESSKKFTEHSPLAPSSPYSASKASADLLVLSYFKTYKLNVSISRSGNNFGERQYPEKLIPLMVKNALDNKPLPIYGNGRNVRDWIYVKDHCEAIDLIIHSSEAGEIYNVGGENEISNLTLVKKICKELDKPDEIIEFVPDRKGHDLRYALSTDKISEELDWHAKADFDKAFTSTINWYKSKFLK
ncbi:MAG: dTDP-glucose 4,6-dehydratase [Ruminococcus sp.]|nr:dTDP-glucose 4,6-dehydratase [Ruminococcus sp.]